jgi:cytoskeletal protein CcmA (bactofilin family)
MLQVKSKITNERDSRSVAKPALRPIAGSANGSSINKTDSKPPPQRQSKPTLTAVRPAEVKDIQTRVPVIIGEATFRGAIPVDGIICGQPGNHGGALSLRQRGRPFFGSEPELDGEITFRDMLRVNGHIAGSVSSQRGTLIVDGGAKIDATVDVAIAVINGAVTGDIVARERVELGPTARIYGNIWTRSLAINSGAIFEGVCQMLENEQDNCSGSTG